MVGFQFFTIDSKQQDHSELENEAKQYDCDTVIQYNDKTNESIVYTFGSSKTKLHPTMHLPNKQPIEFYKKIQEEISGIAMPHLVDQVCKFNDRGLFIKSDEVNLSKILN